MNTDVARLKVVAPSLLMFTPPGAPQSFNSRFVQANGN